MTNLTNEEQAKIKTLAILENVDLSRNSINIFLIDRGDMSRYHEIVALQYHKNEWFIIENYLTPEYSFLNKTKIENLSLETLNEWVESFILVNDSVFLNNAVCQKDGLTLP